MRIFEFRNPTPIQAFGLAPDQDDASELFQEYVLARGGDPDSLLWRELALPHLDEDARAGVRDAMRLNREGLIVREGVGRWAFVIPVGGDEAAR
jgi:hypothetical protein